MTITFRCGECEHKYKVSDEDAGRQVTCKKCGAGMTIPQPEERTEGGQPIYRHDERTSDFQPAVGDGANIERISDHIEEHIGPIESVFHEIISDLVHIDVHMVPPTQRRNCYTLVTSGMSDLPMTVPDGYDEFSHAELVISLPPDWPLNDKLLTTTQDWPVGLLKSLARMPHEYSTWLGFGHTIPNGDPPDPYADGTRLAGVILIPAFFAGEQFCQLDAGDKVINFYSILPIYPEEMDLKLKTNADTLFTRLEKKLGAIPFVLDETRANVGKKKRFGIF